MIVETTDCTTAREFLERLDPNHDDWGTALDNPWLYRGQNDSLWPLKPRAWRQDGIKILGPLRGRYRSEAKAVLERYLAGKKNYNKEEKTLELIESALSELAAVNQFERLADQPGLHVRAGSSTSPEFYVEECGRLSQGIHLRHGAYNFPNFATALAQHHGVPTRLLDWTRDPRIAAFFAVNGVQKMKNRPKQMAVWALNAEYPLERVHIKVFEVPREQFEFLHAQEGLFTWLPRADSNLLSGNDWPSLEEHLGRPAYAQDIARPMLRKITLPTTEAGDLLRLLNRERISVAHLMPTYDYVTETLFGKWRQRLFLEAESIQREFAALSNRLVNPMGRSCWAGGSIGTWSEDGWTYAWA